jgi:transketolase
MGGLDGHPDVGVPGIEASSGSLGMGISKGRGIALAKRALGRDGLVVVMTGDGELQEGQNWEALQAAAHERLGRLWIVVDRNEVQSDKRTEEIVALGDLESKLRAFGWEVETVDGHDHAALRAVFGRFRAGGDAPKALVARTVKGKGVSFMEHPVALAEGGGTYRWHAGAPGDEPFARAVAELEERLAERCAALRIDPPALEPVAAEEPVAGLEGEPESGAGARAKPSLRDSAEYVVESYGETLLELGAERPDLVVLDADLASDCRTRAFELAYPDRFFQCGIAEQDMVSTAAGMARHGLLPVVNSFASFLASRANEQIYNQASEGSRVVYALHYAGLIPAGPGKSHQSVRDISLLAALPDVVVVQPGSSEETRGLVRWAVEQADATVAVRLAIGPSPRRIELPSLPPVGQGTVLRDGDDAVLLGYGPVMLHEALLAAEGLAERGELSLRVVAMPWLNRFDADWLVAEVAPLEQLFVLEDHAPVGGLGDGLRAALPGRVVTVFGVEGWPACGSPDEALRYHGLDGASLAARVTAAMGRRADSAASSVAR